jgi:hypothetical protein
MGGSGDPVTDLQQAVSSPYGFEPSYAPQPDSTDLGSNNSFMSPTTNITDDHSVSFGMGGITLGDIVSGDGAVSGHGTTVSNGDIHSGSGSTVTVGDGNAISERNTSAGGDVLSSHDGTVIQTSGHGTTTVSNGNTTSVHGNQTITEVHSSSIVDTSVHDSSMHDASLHDNSIHETTHTDTGLDAHLGF